MNKQIHLLKYYHAGIWGFICPYCGKASKEKIKNPYHSGLICDHCGVQSYPASDTGYTHSDKDDEPVINTPLLLCPYCEQFIPFEPGYINEDGSFDCYLCKKIIFCK